MREPLVAVVGRPNVGKSTLFNRIVGKRISIVNDEPGVTRDRIFDRAEWTGRWFTLVDTGGLDFDKNDEITANIVKQSKLAIENADVVLFVVDGKDGLTETDKDVARILRKSKKKVVLAVNKIDRFDESIKYEYYELGLGEPFLISATHGMGVGDLLDEIVAGFETKLDDDEDNGAIKLAIVGKPNAGKSSLTNSLLGEERVIVSSIAGTTRDSINIPFKYDGKDYVLIDTAGMRRKSKIEDESVERYSIIRTLNSIRSADVVLMVMDTTTEISDQDLKIASFIDEEEKPCVLVMNKWDLIEKETGTMNEFEDKIKSQFVFMPYYKSVYLSAKTTKRLEKLMPAVETVLENSKRKVRAGDLNDVLMGAISVTSPPMVKGKKLNVFYATQSEGAPIPTFILFVNDLKLMTTSYERYLENSLRKAFDFCGTPIKIVLKCKGND